MRHYYFSFLIIFPVLMFQPCISVTQTSETPLSTPEALHSTDDTLGEKTGPQQQNSAPQPNALKPLRSLDSDGTTHHPPDSKTANSTVVTPSPDEPGESVLGISVAAGALIGGALHEKADVRNQFKSGAALGLVLNLRLLQFNAFRFGADFGVSHFTNKDVKRSAVVEVASRKNRVHVLVDAEFHHKAFFVNAGIGAGFLIYGVETTLVQEGAQTTSSNHGTNPGFMTAVALGLELGQHVFHSANEIRLSAYTDWMRHDERDEFVIGALLSVQIFSKFK